MLHVASALSWCPELSDHRPVSFSRRCPQPQCSTGNKPIPTAILRRPDWKERVERRYEELMARDLLADRALRRLHLVKRAMREVSSQLMVELKVTTAESLDDQLDWTMRFIRAAQQVRISTMEKCAKAYPYLAELVSPQDPLVREGSNLDAVRSHAVELARQSAMAELSRVENSGPGMDDQVRQRKKEQILTKLKRLVPGTTACLAAVQSPEGEIITEPKEMAELLRRHWASVFSRKGIHEAKLCEWLSEEFGAFEDITLVHLGLPDRASPRWIARRQDIAKAISLAASSAPGPDGIPYEAWKTLGDLAIDILNDAGHVLEDGDARHQMIEVDGDENRDSHEFNFSNMFCIPKKPSGKTDHGEAFYAPAATRPLSVVNTDNRIIANSRRLRWEVIFNEWVSEMQKGFLPGRSMSSNIIDIETEAMRVSLRTEYGAIILFDLEAAFPSVSHTYMFRILEYLQLPSHVLNFVKALYDENRCQLVLAGQRFEGFNMESGIRQGCPLSPMLFAVVVDILLRRLARILPSAIPRAFADDTAIVVDDLAAHAHTLAGIFNSFGDISGLKLNLPKCVVIPLWDGASSDQIAQWEPAWDSMCVASWGRYLGLAIGPGKLEHSWDNALPKYVQRAHDWSAHHLGLQFSAAVYNTYVATVLSYIWQLERFPAQFSDFEAKAFRKLASGPGNWIQPSDLFYAKEVYGQARSFVDARTAALAARIRVYTWEASANGGLRAKQRAADLETTLRTTDFWYRKACWRHWYENAIARTLTSSIAEFLQLTGISVQSVLRDLRAQQAAEEPSVRGTIKSRFQKEVYLRLMHAKRPIGEDRFRKRLARWDLPGVPLHVARRSLRQLNEVSTMVPPRISAAILSTAWNRWCTSRRFQNATERNCLLGCVGAEDSIEHYSRCAVVHNFASTFLRMSFSRARGLEIFTFCYDSWSCRKEMIKAGILIYAVYRTTETLRKDTSCPTVEMMTQMLQQSSREAVRGHGGCMRILDDPR